MSLPEGLLEDLRGLARKYGSMALVAGCAQFVAQFALKGMQAEIEERRGEKEIDCPRCRRQLALVREVKETIKPARRGGEPEKGSEA